MLAYLSDAGTRTSSVIELATLFKGDNDIRTAIEVALDEELDHLAGAPVYRIFRPHERRARELLLALHRMRGVKAVERLEAVLTHSIEWAPTRQQGQR